MTFRKFFIQWLMTTLGFGILAYLIKNLAPTHTLWPFAISFLYIGVLVLLLYKALLDVLGQRA